MGFFSSNKSDAPSRSPGAKLKLPEILHSNVYGVTTLDAAHFVFLITFNNDEQVVLKAEKSITTDQLARAHNVGVRIMGMVSAVSAETLTPRELMEVDRLDVGITTAFFRAEKAVQSGEYRWVKAAFQKNLRGMKTKEEAYVQNEGDRFGTFSPEKKVEIAAYMARLSKSLTKNKKAWASLGQIIAVDMLLGNTDRVDLSQNADRGRITNWGNCQFREANGKIIEAVGLDSFDSLHLTTSNISSGNIDDWIPVCGTFLKDPKKAKVALQGLIEDSAEELKSTLGVNCTWGKAEAAAFYEGYEKGLQTLKKGAAGKAKTLMGGKAGGFSIPQGLLARMHWLGWL